MITRYLEFLSSKDNLLKENVQLSKDLLKKLEIQRRKDKGLDTKLTPEEIKNLEKDPYFIEIKDMVSKTPGITYLFVKTFFKDRRNQWESGSDSDKKRCLEDLKNIYEDLLSKRDLWSRLPMPMDKYAAIEPDEFDTRPGIERLTDDWRDVLLFLNAKKLFIDRLPSFQKAFFNGASKHTMEQIKSIADSFASFGLKEDGTIDKEENKMMNDDFFQKCSNIKSKEDLIDAAKDHIKTASKSDYKYFRRKIEEANNRFGLSNGAEIVWEERGFMVVKIKSFSANQLINTYRTICQHCISDTLSSWNNYANIEEYKRQYYIYNFNVVSSEKTSIIGATIDRNGNITHCHARRDENFISQIDNYLSSNGIPKSVLAPYTLEEQVKITSRIEASKTLRKEGITFDEIKKALDNGGDVNVSGKEDGIALKNAVKSGDFDSVKLLVDSGAKVNLPKDLIDNIGSSSIKEKAKIISILISNGLRIEETTYPKIRSKLDINYIPDVVRTMLDNGLDPNLSNGVILRDAINTKNVEWVKQMSKYDTDLGGRNYIIFLNLLKQGQKESEINTGIFEIKLIDIVFSKFKSTKDIIFKDDELRRKTIFHWCGIEKYYVEPGEDDVKAERIGILLDKLVEYGCNPDYSSLIKLFTDDMKDGKDKSEQIYLKTIIKELSKRL